jgi:uncharacterized protein (DUF1330 family)
MPAYVITDARVISQHGVDEYRRIAKSSIAHYGGRYLALSDKITVLEGEWSPPLLVILEFPDGDAARAWYASPEYAAALPIAADILDRSMIVVDQPPRTARTD